MVKGNSFQPPITSDDGDFAFLICCVIAGHVADEANAGFAWLFTVTLDIILLS